MWLLVLINFIVIVIICRTVVNKFMEFMGADWYMFDVKGRAIFCLVLAIILALFGI